MAFESNLNLDKDLEDLWLSLKKLHHALRKDTYKKYKRINPFYEDLFSWKERGQFWVDDDNGITIYNSTSIVGDVKIGKNTWIGPFCSLDGSGGLIIGKYCSISLGCQLLTHDTVKWALSGGNQTYEYAATSVGDCCFIGSHAVINKGVKIGNHCVIGAGAVVTSDIGDNSIACGVPAKTIGKVIISKDGNISLSYN